MASGTRARSARLHSLHSTSPGRCRETLRADARPVRAVTGVRAFVGRATVGAAPRTRRARYTTAVLSAFTACCALSGCVTNQRSAAEATPVLPRTVTAQEVKLLDRAEQMLVRRCMSRHGFKLWITARSALPETARFRYVVDDIASARKHGFGGDIERRAAKLRRTDPNARYFSSLSPSRREAALRALNGERPVGLEARLPSGIVVTRSDRSCTSQAERALYGDLERWYRVSKVVGSLTGVRVGRVTTHPSFVSATRRWATCMADQGYPFSIPPEAREAVTRSSASRRPIIERRIAVAEATCARTTGLSGTAERLDGMYARDVRNEYRAVVAAARRLRLAALPRARNIDRAPTAP